MAKHLLPIGGHEAVRMALRLALAVAPHRADTERSGEKGGENGGMKFEMLRTSIGAGALLSAAAPVFGRTMFC